MDTNPNYHYGAPIAQDDADALFARFIEIRKRSLPKIKAALADDPEATRYYCGRPGADPMLEDWAFVFDKTAMNYVMQKMEEGGAGCVFFIHGAHGAPAAGGSPDYIAEQRGRPTLMLIPATYNANPAPSELQFKLLADKGGAQQPGTGGGTQQDIATQPIRLPAGFQAGHYNP